jgi:uncharacterized protein YndB with AHSA1/START domain
MDIHHAHILTVRPERIYTALTQPYDLEAWIGAPTSGRPEVGSQIEFQLWNYYE